MDEIATIINWIRKLLSQNYSQISAKDVGVVSPYRKQCQLIEKELKNNGLSEITVGTAEVYQGQERKVIIVSSVRTGSDLGFVRNEQVTLNETIFAY